MKQQRRSRLRDLKITRGALTVLGLSLGLSLVWLLSSASARATIEHYLIASPSSVFERGFVWTLVTSPLLEVSFLSLLFNGFLMWMLIPILERFWGTARFYRFFVVTVVVAALVGTGAAFALGVDRPIHGLGPFMLAAVVAFGVIYASQPVQFFGVLPLTGRQFMLGMLGFSVLFVVLQGLWEQGAADAGAVVTAFVMTSKRWSPALAWRRWQIARARAKLTVIQGGAPGHGKPATTSAKSSKGSKSDDQKWLN